MNRPLRLLDLEESGHGANAWPEQNATLRFFTICARNFLPAAEILVQSILRHHPQCSATVYLCDRDTGYDPADFEFEITPLEHLGIPDLEAMIRRYNITELCTAIKPFCFLREFGELPSGPVIYLDPDIEVFSPLEEVATAMQEGASMVLTPHVLNPAEYAEHNDRQYLQMGIYNLGFAACRNTPDVNKAMHWWARRMVSECVIDLPNGLFVDQKWADLLPAFIDNFKVLRHPGYNVAYWNLQERRIGSNDGEWTVNGQPLRFAHYSGVRPGDTDQLSRHSDQYTIHNSFGYGDLVAAYRRKLNTPRNRDLRQLPYGFFWENNASVNLHTPTPNKGKSWRQPQSFCNAHQFFALEELEKFKSGHAHYIEAERDYERSLVPNNRVAPFNTQGFCYACEKNSRLTSSFMFADPKSEAPNWREHLACEFCGMPNRIRAALHFFLQEFDPSSDARIYLTEQKTRLFDWLSTRFANLKGSEYFGPEFETGALVDGIRNEDIERLSFQDSCFDFVLSFDVLEHVADDVAAFIEAYRVLTPGGYFFFTAPARMDRPANEIRAERRPDGSVNHLMAPEYHGNPVDPEGGALCYRYFSWQMMDDLRKVGFRRPFLYRYWSREFGYLGPDQMIFVAQRPN